MRFARLRHGFDECVRSEARSYWRNAFFGAEMFHCLDYLVTSEELSSLTFDFRFWTLPLGDDVAHPEYRTGLRQSFSHSVVMAPLPARADPTRDSIRSAMGIDGDWAEGHVLGHPNGDGPPYITWFSNGREVQWGYVPNLWPMGYLRRLPNWGVEIQNPNVCLRAIDPSRPRSSDELFADLLRTLRKVSVRMNPDGSAQQAELPARYLDSWLSSNVYEEMT